MKSILLHVGDDAEFEGRLQAALDVARFTGGHLECLQTRRVPAFLGGDSGTYGGGATMVMHLIEEEAKHGEAERKRIGARLAGEQVNYSFSESMGDPARTLVDRSLLNDVIVMSQAGPKSPEAGRTLAEVVTRANTPVLAIPHDAQRLEVEKPMLVAWKPTPEAAHAVKAAVPLLQRATRVEVLAIDPLGVGDFPATAVAAYLSRHGIKAELHERASGDHSTSDVLMATARELGAGLVVMGGYGRGRAMEFLMGGVTRRFLASSPLALLMAH